MGQTTSTQMYIFFHEYYKFIGNVLKVNFQFIFEKLRFSGYRKQMNGPKAWLEKTITKLSRHDKIFEQHFDQVVKKQTVKYVTSIS